MEINDIELTKLSSKGQIVIPSEIRERLNIKKGSIFAVTTNKEMIILKKLDSRMKAEDIESLKIIEEAWDDIEKGNYKKISKEKFFEELAEW